MVWRAWVLSWADRCDPFLLPLPDQSLQNSGQQVRVMSEWFRMTNKERKRYRVEAQVAKARGEADRRREVEAALERMRMMPPSRSRFSMMTRTRPACRRHEPMASLRGALHCLQIVLWNL